MGKSIKFLLIRFSLPRFPCAGRPAVIPWKTVEGQIGQVSYLLAIGLFAGATVYAALLWRSGFDRDSYRPWWILLFGEVALTIALWIHGWREGHCPVGNIFEAAAFFAWGLGMAYLLTARFFRIVPLAVGVAPILLGLTLFGMEAWIRPIDQTIGATGLRNLHITLSILAYGAFGIAAAAAALYLLQSYELRSHLWRALRARLPSLNRLQRTCTVSITVGWVLFTVGIAIGTIWAWSEGRPLSLIDVKVLWSLLVWAGYGGLAFVAWRRQQFGHREMTGVLLAFLFLGMTFWWTSLLSPLHRP